MAGTGLYIATDGAFARIDGKDVVVEQGQIARAGHPIMESHGHLFEPLTVHYDLPEPEAEEAPKPSARTRATGKG
jgi:hypothetical protein